MRMKGTLSTLLHNAHPVAPLEPQCKPRKAALLIGIKYRNNDVWDTLNCPHKDALSMQTLLIELYKYEEKNIVVLLDDGKHKAPTKENILEEMRALVVGTRSGDQLFFHYSGHGDQVECEKNDTSEDDNMDEAIIPCDATNEKETWIIDNVMNRILVRKLAVGAQLIAIFDSCHSGTALDLKHYECNRVYVPFQTKIRRWTARTKRRGPIHRNALVSPAIPGAGPCTPRAAVQAKHMHRSKARHGSFHVYKRTSDHEVQDKKFQLGSSSTKDPKKQRVALTKHENTLHIDCELTPTPDAETPPSPTTAHAAAGSGSRICRKCGGSLVERKAETGTSDHPENAGAQRTVRRSISQTLAQGDALERMIPARSKTLVPAATSSPACDDTPVPSSLLCLKGFRFSWPLITSNARPIKSGQDMSSSQKKKANATPPARSSASISSATRMPLVGLKRQSTPVAALCSIAEYAFSASAMPAMSEADSQYYEIGARRTTSPEPLTECRCRFSRPSSPERVSTGQAISIAAARDAQLAFEDETGKSMTSALIEILRKEPNPTFRSLMTSLSHLLWDRSNMMHRYFRKIKTVKLQKEKEGMKRPKRPPKAQEPGDVASDVEARANEFEDYILAEEPIQVPVLGSEHPIPHDMVFHP